MTLFSLIDVAYAQGAKPAQPSTLEILIMPLAFIVIMYFLVIRPQQKKACLNSSARRSGLHSSSRGVLEFCRWSAEPC
jgi:hypothetical protein